MLSIRLGGAGLFLSFDDGYIRDEFLSFTRAWTNENGQGGNEGLSLQIESSSERVGIDELNVSNYLFRCAQAIEIAKELLGGPETVSGTPEELEVAEILQEREDVDMN